MSDAEAIASLPANSSWIGVKETPDDKKVAEMIARNHRVRCAHGKTMSFIEVNQELEKKYCWSDAGLEAACIELSERLPFRVVPKNFEV